MPLWQPRSVASLALMVFLLVGIAGWRRRAETKSNPLSQMAIVKRARLGLDHVADAAPRPDEVSMSRHRPSTAETTVPALAGQFPQYAANGVPGARARLTAARNQERFFASQETAGGPIVAPRITRTVPILQQPDPREMCKCSEFLNSGEWAIQDSNQGPLPEWKIAVARDRRWGSRPDLRVRLEDYAMPSGRFG